LQEKAVEATKQNEEKRKKPKPEEREGMPQHQHCHNISRCQTAHFLSIRNRFDLH
jgi:hypothetical protein